MMEAESEFIFGPGEKQQQSHSDRTIALSLGAFYYGFITMECGFVIRESFSA